MEMNDIRTYTIRRLFSIIPVLFGISALAFSLAQLAPGDPAQIILDSAGLGMPSDEDITKLRAHLGLDAPVLWQYALWLGRLLQGDGGMSYHLGMPVFQALCSRLPVTVTLASAALCWVLIGGIGLGVLLAHWRETTKATCCLALTQVLIAAPSFLVAILLIFLFGVRLHILPTSGADSAAGYILPSLSISLVTLAMTAQLLAERLEEALSSSYAQAARLRGLSERRVLFTYALPNALLPVIAMIGNFFAGALGGAVIVETIFALPGIGALALDAIHYRDYPLLQGYVLLLGTAYVFVTLIVDLLMAKLDPRILREVRR